MTKLFYEPLFWWDVSNENVFCWLAANVTFSSENIIHEISPRPSPGSRSSLYNDEDDDEDQDGYDEDYAAMMRSMRLWWGLWARQRKNYEVLIRSPDWSFENYWDSRF